MLGAPFPTFTYFPLLPFDIRSLIWTFVAFQPRNLDIWAQELGIFRYSGDIDDDDKVFRYVTTHPPPAMLHVNRESREIGRQHYVLRFDPSNRPKQIHRLEITTAARIYINPVSDRVCLMGDFPQDFYPVVFPPKDLDENDEKWYLNPPLSTAVNIFPIFLSGQYDETEFIAALGGLQEALLYYSESEEATQLSRFGKSDVVEFVDYDNGTMEDRGLCANLKAELQAHEPKCLNMRWVTLVVDGQKWGMQ